MSKGTTSRERILVVEDNRDSREALGLILSRLGHEVQSAPSVQEALALVDECPPRFMLLDLMLPDVPGIQLLRCIRAKELPGSC